MHPATFNDKAKRSWMALSMIVLCGASLFATTPTWAEDLDATIARKVREAKLATTLPIVWPTHWQRVGEGKPLFVNVVAYADGYVIGLSHERDCQGADCSRSYLIVSSASAAKPEEGAVTLKLGADVTASFTPTSWSKMSGLTDAELWLRAQGLDIYLLADLTRNDIVDQDEQAIMTSFARSFLERLRLVKASKPVR